MIRRMLPMAMSALMALTGLTGGLGAQENGRDQMVIEAQRLEAAGEDDRAAELYRQLYADTPSDLVYWRLIQLYERTEAFDRLADLVRDHLTRDPDDLDSARYLARALSGMGDRDGARRILDALAESDLTDIGRVMFVAGEYVEQREFDRAADLYLRSRRALDDPTVYGLELARIYGNRGDTTGALAEYLRALAMTPAALQAVTNLIAEAEESGMPFEQLREPFDRHLEEFPGDTATAQLFAGVLYGHGAITDAVDVITRAAAVSGQGDILWAMAEELEEEGHPREALTAYDAFVGRFPADPLRVEGRFRIAALAAELGDTDRARREYGEIVASRSGTADAAQASLRLIGLSADRTSFEDRMRLIRETAESTEYREVAREAWIDLGDGYLRAGMPEDARGAYDNAVLKSGGRDEQYVSHVKLAQLALFTGDRAALDTEAQGAFQTRPDGDEVNDLLMWKVLAMRCVTDADSAAFGMLAAGLYAAYRDSSDVAAALLQPVAEGTTVPAPYAAMELAGVYTDRGRTTDAIAWYRRAADAAGDTALVVEALVRVAELTAAEPGGIGEARSLYLSTITAYPGTVYDTVIRRRLRELTGQ